MTIVSLFLVQIVQNDGDAARLISLFEVSTLVAVTLTDNRR
jgi:hypothetical protein